jgi:general secretion pathway protein D
MQRLSGGVCLLLAVVCSAGICLADDTAPVQTPAAGETAASPSSSTSSLAGSASTAAPATESSSTTSGAPVPAAVFIPPSRKDRKAAHHAFSSGLKLQQSNQLDQAFYEFEEAARLDPERTEYVAAREMTREHLASTHLDQGNNELLQGRQADALAEFRAALSLDPQNEFAQQRVRDALGPPPANGPGPAQVVARQDDLAVRPLQARHDFHYRGDARGLLTAVATSYGLSVDFDESFPTRPVRFDIDQADFQTALRAASEVTKTFSVAVEDTVLFAAADTVDNHRLFDRMGMRSFYITSADASKDLQDVMNTLRNLFEFRFVSLNAAASTITVRGPMGMLQAASEFLEQLNSERPEVLLDVQVMEVDHTYTRNIGLHVPDQFNLYNIPAAAIASLGGANIQDLLNQLISGGSINQAGNMTIAALLSQLTSQQSGIFSQPLATFGGGLTLEGLSLDSLSAVLSLNESSVQSLDHVTLRASQDKEATFKLGARYPVLNASFSPIANSSAIAGVLGNQSYTAPFPSVNYEDIGLTLKAKPTVHHNSDVALELTVQLRALGTTNSNGIPIITQREFTGGILLKNGEPAFVAGMITTVDQRSLNGLPLFAQVPGFGVLTSQNSKQSEEDELLILITPHVVSEPQRTEAPLIWINK